MFQGSSTPRSRSFPPWFSSSPLLTPTAGRWTKSEEQPTMLIRDGWRWLWFVKKHSTGCAFRAPEYAPQIPYLVYLTIFGHVIERAKYGQVGCPLKDFAKCSSDALTLCSWDPPVKSYDQIPFLAWSPHCNCNVKLRMGGPEKFMGLWIRKKSWSLVLLNRKHMS